MDTFTLAITLGNDAMKTRTDINRALREVIAQNKRGVSGGIIRDVNGNTVGEWQVS